MAQFSNADRKTIVIRVPRKYRSLVRAFCIWLKVQPNQAGLWNCEEKLSQAFEDDKAPIDIAAEYSAAMRWLSQPDSRRVG
jgi:hypothetical protein